MKKDLSETLLITELILVFYRNCSDNKNKKNNFAGRGSK